MESRRTRVNGDDKQEHVTDAIESVKEIGCPKDNEISIIANV
jgi:hypothetical protein